MGLFNKKQQLEIAEPPKEEVEESEQKLEREIIELGKPKHEIEIEELKKRIGILKEKNQRDLDNQYEELQEQANAIMNEKNQIIKSLRLENAKADERIKKISKDIEEYFSDLSDDLNKHYTPIEKQLIKANGLNESILRVLEKQQQTFEDYLEQQTDVSDENESLWTEIKEINKLISSITDANKLMYNHKCNKCGAVWKSNVISPLKCTSCQSKAWNKVQNEEIDEND